MERTNATVSRALDEVGDLLEEQGANAFRVKAWRTAAAAIRSLNRPVAEIFRDVGLAGLDGIPGVGPSLARAIREILQTGRLAMQERLQAASDPVARIAAVPGIGPKLAERIHLTLGIESLEELERAAHDGRLRTIAGFGARRVASVRDILGERLRTRHPRASPEAVPDVAELLGIDREYRKRAADGSLVMIAPRRFNPHGEQWLPVFHATRGARHYTALYSNTALAHRLGRTRDWVVLYYEDEEGHGGQATVVTGQRGPLAGRRIVRGRESECVTHYHLNAPRPARRAS